MNASRRTVAAALAGLPLAALADTPAERAQQPTDDPAAAAVWKKVRASLFGQRPIDTAPPEVLQLEAPARAVDASVVPVALRARAPAGANYTITRLYLFIDANPSPVSGIFTFGPASARAEVETRVRIDGYSFVRAVAETSDGRLLMTHRFVKASGGCSAPPGGDAAAALATMGRIAVTTEGEAAGSTPVRVQLAIQHPNYTGLAMDQLTRQFTPAHYVRKVDVTYAGQPAFSADVDFSMSENPNFRFWLQPRNGGGELQVAVVDSRERTYAAKRNAP